MSESISDEFIFLFTFLLHLSLVFPSEQRGTEKHVFIGSLPHAVSFQTNTWEGNVNRRKHRL